MHAAQSIRSRCKSWLDQLPPNTALKLVATDASGHTLAVALNALNPQTFADHAKEILNDATDFGDIKKTVAGALGRAGNLSSKLF